MTTQNKAILETVASTARDGYTLFPKLNVKRDLVHDQRATSDLQGKEERGSGVWLITSEVLSLIYTTCQT